MPPRSAFAFGLAAGLSLVYFVGLFQGLSLGTLLWRSALGGLGFGAFFALLVLMLGDPLEIPPERGPGSEEDAGDDEAHSAPGQREE